VTAALLTEAVGKDRVQSIFVDTGLMRLNEATQVMQAIEIWGYK